MNDMGNKILKIALPLIILGIIVFVINRTQKSIVGIAPTEVIPFSFGTYINDLVQSNLKDKPYAQAKDEYRRIYDIIKTEEQLIATDSAGIQHTLLPDTTVQGCYSRIFEGYWPSFESLAEGVFKSDWSSKKDQLSVIKMEAEDLRQRKGSAMRNDSLTHYIAYANDYEAASKFVKNVSCSSKEQYEGLIKSKDNYKKQYPLNKNSELVRKLNEEVQREAKDSWKNSITKCVDRTCMATDLEQFLNGFYVETKNGKKTSKVKVGKSICDNMIADFNSKFNGEMGSQNDKLRDRWYGLLEDAVNEACRMDNLSAFSNVRSDLRNKIDAYGSDPRDLKGILDRRYNQLRDYYLN